MRDLIPTWTFVDNSRSWRKGDKKKKSWTDGRCLYAADTLAGLQSVLATKAVQDADWSLFKMCANDAH